MLLWYTRGSPYADKARIAVHELGLVDRVSLIESQDDERASGRPWSQMPVLVPYNEEPIFDLGEIIAFLNHEAGGGLYPNDPAAYYRAIAMDMVADRAIKAAVVLAEAEADPGQPRDRLGLNRLWLSINVSLDILERDRFAGAPCASEFSAAALCRFLAAHWPERFSATRQSHVAGWYAAFACRPSMTALTAAAGVRGRPPSEA